MCTTINNYVHTIINNGIINISFLVIIMCALLNILSYLTTIYTLKLCLHHFST